MKEEDDEKKCHVSAQDNENLNDMSIQKIANTEEERVRKTMKLCIQNNHSLD